MTRDKHLAITKAKVSEEQDLFFMCCAELEFDHQGHRSFEDAVVWHYREAKKTIAKHWAEHLSLFPDDE